MREWTIQIDCERRWSARMAEETEQEQLTQKKVRFLRAPVVPSLKIDAEGARRASGMMRGTRKRGS